ncbi:MAG: HIT family protein [Clostridia bacterium]|nr:HIT family protein [Clostridia bacterium]
MADNRFDDSCLFCKIIKGEIPSYKIYEDEDTYAFLDIAGDVFGHTLVIPKNHAENIFDVTDEDLTKVIHTVKKIVKHYKTIFADGVNIVNCSDKSAEQSVFHLHFHIYPRKQEDGLKVCPSIEKSEIDFVECVKKLKIK